MGHSYVQGIKPPDDDWQRMKAIWDACRAASIDPPEEVGRFFDGDDPDPAGVLVDQDGLGGAVREWDDGDMRDGFEVEVAKLPPGIKVVRFVNSY